MPRTMGPGDASSSARRIPYALGLIFVAMAVGIIIAGYLYYASHERHYRAEVGRQLSAVAKLKMAELADRRYERLGMRGTLNHEA